MPSTSPQSEQRWLRDVGAVLLDMDGTLVDSDAAVDLAWVRWAAEYSIPASALQQIAHGRPALSTVRELAPWLDDQAAQQAADRQVDLQVLDADGTVALPGATELLAVIDRLGLPWAVVTSADARLAKARLSAAGIAPPLLVTIEDVLAGKPDPEPYLAAAARLGVDLARCLVVEDSLAGIEAGRRAGARVAALRGHPADLSISGLAELAHLLARSARPWWVDAVGYQVYLPSFQDSDGDGWGDLDGVRSRLDHLVDLGVDLLWLTPFFVSPMRDHGYDVADHLRVDPRFGGDEALDRLVADAHERGLHVLGDLVVNHTSDQHSWFQASRADRSGPYRDYYIWRDPAADGGPPNNWLSHFGGPAWTLDRATGQYYLHLFRPEQPDLNWRNPAVADEIDQVIEHWLRRGLDGFRVDTAAYLIKHAELPDNPALPDGELLPARGVTEAWRRQEHRYDIHQPDVHAVHARWRRLADRYRALLVGEVYEQKPMRLAKYVGAEGLHLSFWFGLVELHGWDPARISSMLRDAVSATSQLSWAQGNHDRSRPASRYGGGRLGARRWLALQVLVTFLPGTSWLYQGDELGLGGRQLAETAAAQRESPNSMLHAVTRLLAVHREIRTELSGDPGLTVSWLDPVSSDVVAYQRGPVVVAANLSDQDATIAASGVIVFDTDKPGTQPGTVAAVHLRPAQAIVLRRR